MKFHTIVLPLMLFSSAAMAQVYIKAPISIPQGNLYMAGSTPDQAEDSAVAAANVSTIGLTSHGDSNYLLASTDRVVQLSMPLTATRTWTLACASTVPAGQTVQIIDPTTNVVPAADVSAQYYPLMIAPKSLGCSDTLNGSVSNTVRLASPGARAVAVSDGVSNWSVTVVRQPERTLDFARDFGGVPAVALGTTDCTLATNISRTVTCPNTDVSSLRTNDQFEAQAAMGDGTTLITTVNLVTPAAHQFTINATPGFDSGNVKVIDALHVCAPPTCSGGSGYAFNSTQTLQTGASGDLPATANPKLMTVVGALLRSGGSGCGTSGSVILTLSPGTYPSALSGVQATFRGTINSSGTLTSIDYTPQTGALYRAIGTYNYDSTGFYEDIPVLPPAPCTIAPKIDITFGVVTEVITNAPNVYASASIPCNDKDTAASISNSTDHGLGLKVECSDHQPSVSFGHDNVAAIKAVNDYETAQNTAHAPVCIKFSGRFLSSAIDLGNDPHLITGAPCLKGDAQILSGIFIFPNQTKSANGDLVIFPIVDANHQGASPAQGMAGTFITNLTFWGDETSPYVENAIKFYGLTQWATVMNVSSWNIRGCLICVGVDDNNEGLIAESTFFNLRTEFTGDAGVNDPASATPAFGLDGIGFNSDNPNNSPNNDLILRYRTYDDNGVPLAIRPCASGGVGHGAHELTIAELKVEQSGMEYSPNSTDGVQVGATDGECANIQWGSSGGGQYTLPGTFQESGVHGLSFVAPNVVNPGVGTAAFHFKGSRSGDLSSMRILGGLISATGNGMGLEFDVSDEGNYVDLVKNNTTDYNLIYSGLVTSRALEYDAHDQVTTALIDPGVNVMTTLRCALGSALTACDGANGQLVDQNSVQTLTNKTLSASIISASTIRMSNLLLSPTAPTIASGFGTAPSIVAANGTAAFQINVGTGTISSSGTITLPTAANGWDCKATDITTQSSIVFMTKQTGSTMTSATFKNYTTTGAVAAWAASDKLNVSCHAF